MPLSDSLMVGVPTRENLEMSIRRDVSSLSFILDTSFFVCCAIFSLVSLKNGFTPLVGAAAIGYAKCITLLLKAGADVNQTDEVLLILFGGDERCKRYK